VVRELGLKVGEAGVEVRVVREAGLELSDAVIQRRLGRKAGLNKGELARDLVHEALGLRLVQQVLLDLPELVAEGAERVLMDRLQGGDPVEFGLVELITKQKIKTTHRSCSSEWLEELADAWIRGLVLKTTRLGAEEGEDSPWVLILAWSWSRRLSSLPMVSS
jgi:hypothetical protein